MEPEVSLLRLQVPSTCSYPEPDQSSPYPPSHFLKIHLNIILSYLPLHLPSGLFPSGFPTNFNNTFPNINWKQASTYEISKIVESLKSKNSCGYDEIPVKILKLSAPFIISPLTYICNKSFSAGAFPERLKYALIWPIYKKEISISSLITDQYPC
jgi:hypothetical protein